LQGDQGARIAKGEMRGHNSNSWGIEGTGNCSHQPIALEAKEAKNWKKMAREKCVEKGRRGDVGGDVFCRKYGKYNKNAGLQCWGGR